MSDKLWLSRRGLLRGLAGGVALAGLGVVSRPLVTMARAPKQGGQAPGFFRFMLGEFEVTIVSDGMNRTPAKYIADNVPEADLKQYLHDHYLSTEHRNSHLNICLINTGSHLVMIDAGAGDNFTGSAGRMKANLAAAGFQPEDVDLVILTHGHPDHVWGIYDDFEEAPRFANARYVIDRVEWDYWTDPKLPDSIGEGFRFFASGAQKNLLPVADLTDKVEPGGEVVPGIRTLESRGHTLGHMSVLVESAGQKLLVTGDSITNPYSSLDHPDWHRRLDMDKPRAVDTRKRLLKLAADERMLISSYHIPFPGVGNIMKRGETYAFAPIVWSWDIGKG